MGRNVWAIGILLLLQLGCAHAEPSDPPELRARREEMVASQIERRDVSDPLVLEAMRAVPRHLFVPEELRDSAYSDHPLPIGEGQTISQPYIVALMTELLGVRRGDRVLEIGTGSGYQAAVLARLTDQVYTIEIKERLYERTRALLESLGLDELVHTRHADGYWGWEEAAPFAAIMITAAVDHVPPPLLDQLEMGGRLVLPLGNPFAYQNLVVVTKTADGPRVQIITGVLFVPMTGRALE